MVDLSGYVVARWKIAVIVTGLKEIVLRLQLLYSVIVPSVFNFDDS